MAKLTEAEVRASARKAIIEQLRPLDPVACEVVLSLVEQAPCDPEDWFAFKAICAHIARCVWQSKLDRATARTNDAWAELAILRAELFTPPSKLTH